LKQSIRPRGNRATLKNPILHSNKSSKFCCCKVGWRQLKSHFFPQFLGQFMAKRIHAERMGFAIGKKD